MDLPRLTEQALGRARSFSKLVFGNRYRLEVAVAIAVAERGDVYARELGRALPSRQLDGPADNQVGAVLQSLAEAGLLLRIDSSGGGQRVFYQRLESPFWDFVEAVWAHILRDSG